MPFVTPWHADKTPNYVAGPVAELMHQCVLVILDPFPTAELRSSVFGLNS